MIKTLTTNRLILQPLSESDNDFILELVNTEGWIKFIGNRNINTRDDAISYIQRINGNENIKYWTVKLRDSGTSIGLVTLIKRDYLEYNDIGFAFLPGYSNKGYAFEATNAVLTNLVELHKLTYILAETLPENITSIKLLKKLGLQFEKVIEIENETLHVYGASVDKLFISN